MAVLNGVTIKLHPFLSQLGGAVVLFVLVYVCSPEMQILQWTRTHTYTSASICEAVVDHWGHQDLWCLCLVLGAKHGLGLQTAWLHITASIGKAVEVISELTLGMLFLWFLLVHLYRSSFPDHTSSVQLLGSSAPCSLGPYLQLGGKQGTGAEKTELQHKQLRLWYSQKAQQSQGREDIDSYGEMTRSLLH